MWLWRVFFHFHECEFRLYLHFDTRKRSFTQHSTIFTTSDVFAWNFERLRNKLFDDKPLFLSTNDSYTYIFILNFIDHPNSVCIYTFLRAKTVLYKTINVFDKHFVGIEQFFFAWLLFKSNKKCVATYEIFVKNLFCNCNLQPVALQVIASDY